MELDYSAQHQSGCWPHRRERLFGLLNPWEDPQDLGWQTIQSGAAIANGGISGVGLGESRAKWGWLPEAHTDFIYAIISEEIGFIGSFLVIALYMIIGFTGLSTALKAPDVFGRLLAAGITLWIMSQAFVNIAAVLGLFPITGITLPFLSFGGIPCYGRSRLTEYSLTLLGKPHEKNKAWEVIISGGGTAGHLMPGISVAKALVTQKSS